MQFRCSPPRKAVTLHPDRDLEILPLHLFPDAQRTCPGRAGFADRFVIVPTFRRFSLTGIGQYRIWLFVGF